MEFSIKDFLNKCDKISRKLQIWSQLLEKSLIENCIFCGVSKLVTYYFTFQILTQIFPMKLMLKNFKNVYELAKINKIFFKFYRWSQLLVVTRSTPRIT